MSMEAQQIPIPRLPRATFNRSKKRVGSYKKGLIYPIYCKYGKPGDHINLQFEVVARKLPTINPSFTEERIVVRVFTVPLRTLWKDWKNWQTGFKEYSDNVPFTEDVPRWTPSSIKVTGPKSLWRHLGFPLNTLPDISPANFKQQAYAWIHDTYFRFRPIQNSILVEGEPGTWKGEELLSINKDRDFFTTGLPYQQLGDAVSLPITGDSKADFLQELSIHQNLLCDTGHAYKGSGVNPFNSTAEVLDYDTNNKTGRLVKGATNDQAQQLSQQLANELNQSSVDRAKQISNAINEVLKNNIVKMDKISSATVSMIRHAFARQLRAENLARTGVFYPDVLMMNWGVAPSYEILGLPKYEGGFTINMVNSEVLQTSATTEQSPLGEIGGHSMGVGGSSDIDIHLKEFAVVMAVAYIKHEQFYNGQGLAQEDYFISNEDLGLIEFQHMSEQPVPKRTLLCASTKKPKIDTTTHEISWGAEDSTATTYNKDTLFFQPIYEHMRTEQNDVVGLLCQEQFYKDDTEEIFIRNNLYNWVDTDIFSIKDKERPAYNGEFLKLKYDNRNYAVVKDGNDLEDNFLIWWNIKANWVSVLDKYGLPGQIDHLGEI
ncbi:major capsid protein [Intestinibacter sp.]|uniref:major capsid protein n=1 Tax=Intestinibacter sp. TaxID=1965304 RepID=UPI00307F333A